MARREPANIWAVKAREHKEDGSRGWHWRYYLPGAGCNRPKKKPSRNWGGEEWIRSPQSRMHIREDVQQGDLVVCYQTDGREIMGFTRMASDGKEGPSTSGAFVYFDLVAPKDALVLDPPLRIADLYATGCRPKCFGPGTQGTIFPVEAQEFRAIVNAVMTVLPEQADRLRDWLDTIGWKA